MPKAFQEFKGLGFRSTKARIAWEFRAYGLTCGLKFRVLGFDVWVSSTQGGFTKARFFWGILGV